MQLAGLPEECRLVIDDTPRSGADNMALDAALLDSSVRLPSAPVVRIYRWDRPTVSLGYFQDHHSSGIPDRFRDCPVVRRLTGGGAILHDRELTYSCVVSKGHPVTERPLCLYDLIHRTIQTCLAECGASVEFRANLSQSDTASLVTSADRNSEFLCFLRSDARDLAVESAVGDRQVKIVGSAQRRRRGAILQHGSILMERSELAPEITGLCDVFADFDRASFEATLPERLGRVLGQSAFRDEFSETETDFAFEYRGSMLQNTDRPDDIALQ